MLAHMTKAKSSTNVAALEVLIEPTAYRPAPVTVLAGADGYLRHEVRRALLAALNEPSEGGEGPLVEHFDGKRAELRDVLDALAERSLFGESGSVVVVEDADPLIKRCRAQWEDYAAKPSRDALLVLEVAQWPANTRLAKQVAQTGLTVHCQVPDRGQELAAFQRRLKQWLGAIAEREYQTKLAPDAAEALLDRLPPEPGLAYQEVCKLALLAGAGTSIDATLVREHVGNWRTRRTWDMIDAAADGHAAEALAQLDRLLAAGEQPLALLPQMASTLRQFATAARLFQQAEQSGAKISLRDALERAGTPHFKLADAQRQLQQLGRPRALHLLQWLLEADLDLKGHNSTGDRARRVLEVLILRLSREASPARSSGPLDKTPPKAMA